MRTVPLRVVIPTLLLVGMTAIAIDLGVRQMVRAEFEATAVMADDDRIEAVLAELDRRVALAAGAVACVAIAWVLASGMRGGRSRPATGRVAVEPALDEVAQMRRRLARTERIAARREVARQVAHEIKNPLAPIQASIETLRRLRSRHAPEFDSYFDEATKTVLAEVRRIASIVSEFSKFARMPTPVFARTDIASVLRSVVALHAAPTPEGPRQVELDVGAIPSILADQDQLTQVFTNLVQNGLEAALHGGIHPQVRLHAIRVGDDVRVTVRDNGPGIEPSVRDRLFEPYVTSKQDGTGLGLAIVQTIVHEHGGEVRLIEEGANGTMFEVVLPIEGPPPLALAPAITVDPDVS